MEQLLGLFAAYLLGVVICAAIVRSLAVRWNVPWRAVLRYFGILPYPDEVLRPARPARPPRRRATPQSPRRTASQPRRRPAPRPRRA